MTRKYTFKRILIYFGAITGGILYLFPIWWSILTSLKQRIDIFVLPPKLIFSPTVQSYVRLIKEMHFLRYMLNSTIVCCISTFIVLILSSLAGYSLCRFNIKGKKGILFWILSLRMAPPIAFIVPIFILFQKARLIDTYQGLIIMYTFLNLPFAVWMMKGFIDKIPIEIEECAMIDGCSRFRILFRIVFPLILPGILAVTFISLIFAWNEFLYAFILTYKNTTTVPVGAASLVQFREVLWNVLGAVALLGILPVVIFSIFTRRYLVSGLTFGAIK